MMFNFYRSYNLIFFLVFVLIVPAYAGNAEKEENLPLQKTCPVMGGAVNKSLFVDHQGNRIYLCCMGCVEPVRNDPEKYIAVIEKKGERVTRIQTQCPVMGGRINKDLYADVKGKRIYVCCAGCISIIQKSPEKYIQGFAEKGIQLDDTPVKKE